MSIVNALKALFDLDRGQSEKLVEELAEPTPPTTVELTEMPIMYHTGYYRPRTSFVVLEDGQMFRITEGDFHAFVLSEADLIIEYDRGGFIPVDEAGPSQEYNGVHTSVGHGVYIARVDLEDNQVNRAAARRLMNECLRGATSSWEEGEPQLYFVRSKVKSRT